MKGARDLKRECVCSKPNIMPSGLFVCLDKGGDPDLRRKSRRKNTAMTVTVLSTTLKTCFLNILFYYLIIALFTSYFFYLHLLLTSSFKHPDVSTPAVCTPYP